MKKLLIRLSIALIVLLVLGIIAIGLFLDKAVKRGVETVGPMLTQVEVKVDSVSLSILSGAGKIKGLLVGNPPGYKSTSAIQVGTASLALQPGSVFSDKVVIKSINVQAPEITFETGLKGNNLSKILANLQSATGGSDTNAAQPSAKAAGKKLQVDDFVISGGKVNVSVNVAALGSLGSQSATVPLPEIRLSGLGQGPDGITAAELTKRVLQEIEKQAVLVASAAVADLSKNAAGLTKGLGNGATGAVDSVTKGLGGFLKKK
jgi:uncharacterized protein involved in outer membrane biogenesis